MTDDAACLHGLDRYDRNGLDNVDKGARLLCNVNFRYSDPTQ